MSRVCIVIGFWFNTMTRVLAVTKTAVSEFFEKAFRERLILACHTHWCIIFKIVFTTKKDFTSIIFVPRL